MITLYCFQPAGGLPDFSPFVVKAMTLLRLAGLDFIQKRNALAGAPKGKLPYIDDDGVLVSDSTFIRFHLEKAHGVDFDKGLSAEQKAQAWAVEKMCEDHLYWSGFYMRWMVDSNFENAPSRLFDHVPAIARPIVKWSMRRKFRQALWAQGTGRHGYDEIAALGVRDIDALSTLLGDKPFLFGETPCGADATVFAFASGCLAPIAESPLRDAALSKPNLVAYRERMMCRCFPDNATK
jgi:glutathione S-transferase